MTSPISESNACVSPPQPLDVVSDSDVLTTKQNPATDCNTMSDYERTRAQNIERNNAKLRALGLLSILEEKKSNDVAWGRTTAAVGIPKEKPKNKKHAATAPPTEGTRRSKRIRGTDPSGLPVTVKTESDIREEREALIVECREARLRAAQEVAKADPDGAKTATKNRTATYEHCLMRVRTMSENGLRNRIKMIERAAGKHCVIKMAIFKCCLQDEGYWDLASEAKEALERLKAVLPPPSSLDI